MNQPVITEGIGFINFAWPELGLRIMAERITDEGSAELRFYSVNGTGESLLHTTRVNLLATPTMNSLAKRLEKNSADIPWTDILTFITGKTLEIARRGEAVVEIWPSEDDDLAPSYLLEPILYENHPAIIFGDYSSLKSLVALVIGYIVQLPYHDNTLGLTTDKESTLCLFLDYEDDPTNFRRRWSALERGFGKGAMPIFYRRMTGTLSDSVEQLQRIIHDKKIGLIIVDSLGPAARGNLNDPEPAIKYHAALRQLGITSLTLAHTSKDQFTKKKSIFGCYSEDTEVLTKDGWKIHSAVTLDDDVACFYAANKEHRLSSLRWEKPLKKWEYIYDGEMIHIKQRGLDALITPNHRILRRTHKKGFYDFVEAQALPRSTLYIPCAARLKPKGSHNGRHQRTFSLAYNTKPLRMDSWLRFIGYWLSEGGFTGTGAATHLTQTVNNTLKKMKTTLDELGFPYTEAKRQRLGWKECHKLLIAGDAGQRNSRFNHTKVKCSRRTKYNQECLLSNWLRDNCGNDIYSKHIPDFIWKLPSNKMQILLDALIEGDGNVWASGNFGYWTASQRLANDVQRLAILTGHHATLSPRMREGNSREQYGIIINSLTRQEMTLNPSKHFQLEKYKGKVYCLTVPSGAYITRRTGRMAVLGNSVFFTNLARSVWECKAEQETGEDEAIISLKHTKANLSRLHPPLGYRFMFTDNMINIAKTDLRDTGLSGELPLSLRIKDLLRDGAMTVKDIAGELEANEATARTAINRMAKKNQLVKVGESWGLSII